MEVPGAAELFILWCHSHEFQLSPEEPLEEAVQGCCRGHLPLPAPAHTPPAQLPALTLFPPAWPWAATAEEAKSKTGRLSGDV